MSCIECQKRIKDWDGDDPKCAFDDAGHFVSNNWNCATLGKLLRIAAADSSYMTGVSGVILYSFDQTCAIIPDDGMFVILGFYKSRGAVENASILDGREMRQLSLADVEAVLKRRAQ